MRGDGEDKTLQPDLFDEQNLVEFKHPDYLEERLITCHNPPMARLRAHKRPELLETTEDNLTHITARFTDGCLQGEDRIGLTVGRVVNCHKMTKHFNVGDH